MGKTKVFSKEPETASRIQANTTTNTSQTEKVMKRILDTLASFIGLIIFAPLYAIIYVAIKWEDGGKVIFTNTSQTEKVMKRILDTLASFIGLIIFAPLYAIIYVAIKWEDGGKVIFRQERVGYKGRIFTLYKFRSMKEKAEENGKPELCQENDCRLTRVGRKEWDTKDASSRSTNSAP